MFQDLIQLRNDVAARHLTNLFQADPQRAANFGVMHGSLLFDYSKTQLDPAIRAALIALCNHQDLAARRAAMFAGEVINQTEDRAVLHTALRDPNGPELLLDGADIRAPLRHTLDRMKDISRRVRDGSFAAAGGPILDIVNIGIGGSDLGPAMATLALAPYHDGPDCHFVSNVDGAHIHDVLRQLDPRRTLIVVASKSFTTIETMTNARTARDWMVAGQGDPARQFLAVSTAEDKTAEFGIPAAQVFGFEDWVGGRYSVWGPVGLSLMLAIGPEQFDEFLAGGKDMDAHFCSAPWEKNMPVMLALVGLWHHQVCGYGTRAVLPYDQRLVRLPAYLQQLEMESNGKSVAVDGQGLGFVSGPVVWGEPGTNGQHAFYQLLHQGTAVVPCEFIVAAQGHEPTMAPHHHLLVANCLAQSEALMRGRTLAQACDLMTAKGYRGEELDRQARHRVFPGNRPSTTLIYPKLTPFVLGQIIALYEHRVFAEGVILGLNSFDQWGVELGKELAVSLLPLVQGIAATDGKDGSTAALIQYVHQASKI